MPLVKNGRPVDDAWITVADDQPLPATAPVIVSLTRWLAERDRLVARALPVGVRLASHEAVEEVVPDLARLALVALEFPTFRDGRAFSTARLLRERYGFKGEIRAVGDVLRDQFLFMVRCGFDALEVADGEAADAIETELERFSVFYQRASDRQKPASVLRQLRRAAE